MPKKKVEKARDDASPCNTKKGKAKQVNQRKEWFFTWNNYPENGMEMLETVLEPLCEKAVWQEELGANGTPHIQGTFILYVRARWSEFGLPKEIHWEKTKWKERALEYCKKERTRNGRTFKKGMPSDLRIIEELRPFQRDLETWSLSPPDDRKIVWIADESGCMGKTVFCKYMIERHNAVVATGGRTADIAQILAGLAESGRDLNSPFTFILNLPRDMRPEHVRYRAIESVKDGLITSAKYESRTLCFNSPHVFVFANMMPNIEALTMDHWEIYKINQAFELVRQ